MFALSPAVLKPRGNYIAQFYLRGVGGEGKRKTHFRAPHTPPSSPNRGNCCLPHTFPPTCSLFTPPFPPSKNDRSAKFPPLTLIATGGQKNSPCSSCCDNALTQLTFLSPKKPSLAPIRSSFFFPSIFLTKLWGKEGGGGGEIDKSFLSIGEIYPSTTLLLLLLLLFLLSHLPSQSCSLSTHVSEKTEPFLVSASRQKQYAQKTSSSANFEAYYSNLPVVRNFSILQNIQTRV